MVVNSEAGVVRDAEQRHRCLMQLRQTGKMTDAFLTRTWGKHENDRDRASWGPLARDIDWTDFEHFGAGDAR